MSHCVVAGSATNRRAAAAFAGRWDLSRPPIRLSGAHHEVALGTQIAGGICMGKTAVYRPVSWQPRLSSSLQWWPTLAGIGLAAFIALGASSGRELAPILAASGFVYLGAAALQKPSAAWPLFFGTFVVIAVNRIGVAAIDATWVFLLLAVLLAAYGLSRGAVLPTAGLPLQTIAMAGFGAV